VVVKFASVHDCMCGRRARQGCSELRSRRQDVAAACAACAPTIRRTSSMIMFPFQQIAKRETRKAAASSQHKTTSLCFRISFFVPELLIIASSPAVQGQQIIPSECCLTMFSVANHILKILLEALFLLGMGPKICSN
jgi:hypothetical protein